MVTITTTVYSTVPPIKLSDNGQGSRELSRRVSRIATLDGGSVVNDYGYAATDRTLTFDISQESRETIDYLNYIVKNYSEVLAASDKGLFLCSVQSISNSNFNLLVKEEY